MDIIRDRLKNKYWIVSHHDKDTAVSSFAKCPKGYKDTYNINPISNNTL
jgi:hypothetical protein